MKRLNLSKPFRTASSVHFAALFLIGIAPLLHGQDSKPLPGANPVLACFEEANAAPRRDYGTVDTGSMENEKGNHYFRFLYSKRDLDRVQKGLSLHSGYAIPIQPVKLSINSVLTFRYRTDSISDLRLSFGPKEDAMQWFLNLAAPTGDWKEMRLPLKDKFSKPVANTTANWLHVTTFARIPDGHNQVTLDLDDFKLEPGGLTSQEVNQIEERLAKNSAAESALKGAVSIENLRTEKNIWLQGEPIKLTFEVVNRTDHEITIPLSTDTSRPIPLIGTLQAWIEPLDEGAKTTNFGRAAKMGKRYAAGGAIFGVGKDRLAARERVHKESSIKQPLAPGRYQYSLELKTKDKQALGDVAVELAIQGKQ